MLDTPFEEVFLSTHAPFEVGAVFRGHGYRIEVCVLEGDRPRVIRITLEEAIESPRWRFLAWRDARFRHIELPKPGMSFVLDRCALDPLLP
ncbi:MAG: hypothetical protein ACKVXR_11570 [Planctomycetota bacterium]